MALPSIDSCVTDRFSPALKRLIRMLGGGPRQPGKEIAGLSDKNRRDVFMLAADHRVDGIITPQLAADETLQSEIRQNRKSRTLDLANRKHNYDRETFAATSLLAGAGIPCILLKGAAIGERFYPPPLIRQYRDIDIMISADDLENACKILVANSYIQSEPKFDIPDQCARLRKILTHDCSFRCQNSEIQIELHWKLDQLRILNLSFDDAGKHAQSISLAGRSVLTLGKEHLFLFLCCHGAKHTWYRLRWIKDIRRILPEMDENSFRLVAKLAETNRCHTILGTSLAILEVLFPKSLTKEQAGYAKHHGNQQQLDFCLESLMHRDNRTHIRLRDIQFLWRSIRYRWSLKPGAAYKFALIFEMFADYRDIRYLKLPHQFLPVYLLAGPFFKMMRYVSREFGPMGNRTSE